VALDNWNDVAGEAVARGLDDLDEMPLARFVPFMWWWCTHGREQADVERFRARLWRPPRGEAPAPQSPWSAENEARAFQALKALTAG